MLGRSPFLLIYLLLWLPCLGCGNARPLPTTKTGKSPEISINEFDPSSAGTIRGRLTWKGDLPVLAPFEVRLPDLSDDVLREIQKQGNPNAPRINPQTKAVAGAVIFLRGIDPLKAKPWNLPPVRVEQNGFRFHVQQGEFDSSIGFVERGAHVEMVSKDAAFHSLHVSGASYFTRTFPDPDQPCSPHFKDKGLMELTSAANYYWMRAYLFVDEHPYYTRTDSQGQFVLDQVPPGNYELVCWMPNWNKAGYDRDPELGHVIRIYFARPGEQAVPLNLPQRKTLDMNLCISQAAFVSN